MSEPLALEIQPLTTTAFAPFGEVLATPHTAGARNDYTRWLGDHAQGLTPRLHVNHVKPAELPVVVCMLERHPSSAQIFLPLDVASYLIVVAPNGRDGWPLSGQAQAFLAPGNLGIAYAPGVWHASITALERAGSFGVLMWRADTPADEEFFPLPQPLSVQH